MRGMRLLLPLLVVLPACRVEDPGRERAEAAVRLTGGDPGRGVEAIHRYGCASCHTIPGIPGDSNVGPPLDRVGSRVYIAGVLLNTPDNLARWIANPPEVDPKTAMPNLRIAPEDVTNISAYLYTLR